LPTSCYRYLPRLRTTPRALSASVLILDTKNKDKDKVDDSAEVLLILFMRIREERIARTINATIRRIKSSGWKDEAAHLTAHLQCSCYQAT